MARKPMSDEQKKAQSERMKQRWADKKTKTPETKLEQTSVEQSSTEQPVESPAPQDHAAQDPNVTELTKMVLELKQQLDTQTALNQAFLAGSQNTQGSQVSRGRLVGTTERYSTDRAAYPDPRDRLAAESRLARIAFSHNYTLDWDVNVTSYETKDGLNMKEPKFTLSLNRIKLDDDGEPTSGRYSICRMVFFEDPETAIVIANDNGLKVDEANEIDFLNEMRYIRVRDWLFECFWPKAPSSSQANKREMVIDGRVVDYFEVSTEGNAKIPFDQLSSKVR